MKLHPLIILWSCLLLVCCEKPKADSKIAPSASRIPQHGHTRGELDPDKSGALRAVLKKAMALESSEAREMALSEVAWSALEIDQNLALEALQHLPAGNTERMLIIQHCAMRLAEKNTDDAITWAASLSFEKEIAAARSQIALVLAETDPYRAAKLLSESGIAGRECDQAALQIIERWAENSTSAAAAWAATFPSGPARKEGIALIVSRWTRHDPAAAFAWIASLQKGEVRNEAFLAMERTVLQQPKEEQEAWLTHADSNIRSELDQKKEQAIQEPADSLTGDEVDENESP